MFCVKCGTRCTEYMKFCPNCGTKLIILNQNTFNETPVVATENKVEKINKAQPIQPAQLNKTAEPDQTTQPVDAELSVPESSQTICPPQNQPPVQPTKTCSPYTYPPVQPAQPNNGMAIASLVFGIASFFIIPILTGLIGIILGGIAKSKGNTGNLSTAGMVCGILGIAGWIVIFFVIGPWISEILQTYFANGSSIFY